MMNIKSMTMIGQGIFSWDGVERRSNRYGAVHLYDKTYNGEKPGVPVRVDYAQLKMFEGKRVRIVAKVIESRFSGHIGDLFLGVRPSKTKVGTCIDLGVGMLETPPNAFDGTPDFVLRPDDGREELWIDPRKLYQLHDHTVEIYIQETTDESEAVAPFGLMGRDPEAIETGDPNGAVQFKNVADGDQWRVPGTLRRLGRETFVIESPMTGRQGNRVPLEVKRKDPTK